MRQELHDYGGGIPNQLVVMLERCVGLNARWPGLVPDAYLTYRLYDLPPHTSQTVQCSTDPVFNDVTRYPLAVTADVMHYFRWASWESHLKFLVLASHLSGMFSSGPAVCGFMFSTTGKIRCHQLTWPRLRSLCELWLQAERSEVRFHRLKCLNSARPHQLFGRVSVSHQVITS